MDVLVDMLLRPRFADLDREREVVLEEIAMYEDSPQDLIHDLLAETVFGASSAGPPGAGFARDHQHHARGRHPRPITTATSASATWWWPRPGNVDHERAARRCSSPSTARTPATTSGAAGTTRLAIEPRRAFFAKETEQMHVCLGGEGLTRNDERRYVLSVLDSLLGRVAELSSLPGGAREARAGLQHLLVLEHVSGRPVCAACTSAAGPIAWVR